MHTIISGKAAISEPTSNLTTSSNSDPELESYLKYYNLHSLHDSFIKNSITIEHVLDLEEDHLKDMGIGLVDRLKYTKAKQLAEKKSELCMI